MHTHPRSPLVMFLGVLTCLAGCIFSEKESRGGSVVENEVRVGILYTENGAPAAGAVVRVYPIDYTPKAGVPKGAAIDSGVIQTVNTDRKGKYKLDSLPPGQYNILGEQNNRFSFQDSVTITAVTDSIPSDTLEAPGSFTAKVVLQPIHDPRSVFIQVLGTNRYVNADSAGSFSLRKMAPGEYSLRISSIWPEYPPLFVSMQVRAGKDDTLGQSILLPYTGIPVVPKMAVRYDTAKSAATLSWLPVKYGFLKEYLVFRSDAASLEVPDQPIARTTDTFYVDDLSGLVLKPGDSTDKAPRFEYRIKVRNLSDQEGLAFGSVRVTAVSPERVTTSMQFESIGGSDFLASIKDTVRIAVKWNNPLRINDSLEWYVGEGKKLVRARKISGLAGSDTLTFPAPAVEGEVTVSVRIRDRADDVWIGNVSVQVFTDLPEVFAGEDTTISPRDSMRLRGRATRKFGSVVKWEWNVGPGRQFVATANGDTTIVAGNATGTTAYVLRVTDDDSNVALDTLEVHVVSDPPVANAGPDTAVTISDRVNLRGGGTDRFGKIVRMEWDIGAKGNFVASVSGDTMLTSKATIDRQINILRVTDDDGFTSLDTMEVLVFNDVPLVSVASTRRQFSLGGGFSFKASAVDAGTMKWEWRLGTSAVWVPGSADTAYKPLVPAGTSVTVKVRGTDEDGNSSEASVTVVTTSWSLLDSIGVQPSYYASAAELDDLIYRIGNQATQLFELPDIHYNEFVEGMVSVWDPATGKARSLRKTTIPIAQPAMVGFKGRLYAFGGDREGTVLQEYEPKLDLWSVKRPMPAPSPSWSRTAAVAVSDGHLYVAMGGFLREYDPATDAWTNKAALPYLVNPSMAAVGGKLFIFPSSQWDYDVNQLAVQVVEYDPATNLATTKPKIFVGSLRPSALVIGTKIYVAGLYDPAGSLMVYDPTQNAVQVKSQPVYPFLGDIVTAKGKIYSFCRNGNHFQPASQIQAHDPADEP